MAASMGIIPRDEGDTRVQDFLDDKLQTSADLDTLDSLLTNVRNQQSLLKKQLQEAETTLEDTSRASQSHASSIMQKAETFKRQQADIDRRLMIVTRSETSDEAAAVFAKSVEKLQRLDVATGYVQMLQEVDRLSTETREKIQISPQAALEPYVRLRSISVTLKRLQPAAEDAAPHLVDHVEKAADVLWREMKDTLGAEFEKTLKKMEWPRANATLEGTLRPEWESGVKKLLDLQQPELIPQEMEKEGRSRDEEVVLLPLEVMMKPLELRFRYHFDGDKPTNRLDKPEYFLSHVTGLLNSYNPFFTTYLQPVLNSYFRDTDLRSRSLCIDATSALIASLLPMVRRKAFSIVPQIASQPQLFSHFMHELMSFDTNLRDEWGFDGGNGDEGWKGLTWEVLVKKDWFGKWLQVEQDFALSRYHSIIDAKDAGEIDYDSVESGVTKPTKAAIRVNDLVETITDRYRPLASFSQKLRFLLDIQIAIFDRFHARLNGGLEAYLATTSTVIRAVQGVSKEDIADAEGVSGLERLCRIYGSAEYLEKAMSDWSDDIFFLELWDELQERARQNTGKNLAGPMSMAAVAERTSSAVGSDEETGGLFDETANAYRKLRERTEGIIVDLLVHSMRDSLRPYTKTSLWSALDPDPTSTISADMDSPIAQLDRFLAFLSSVLAPAPLRRISRQVVLAVQNYLWDYVLLRNSFSMGGAAQFARDVGAVGRVVDRYLGEGQGAVGMRKLNEGIALLSLPVEAERETADGEGNGDEMPGLEEVEARVFESNEKAREVLHQLGLAVLSESEARRVLQARVELGS